MGRMEDYYNDGTVELDTNLNMDSLISPPNDINPNGIDLSLSPLPRNEFSLEDVLMTADNEIHNSIFDSNELIDNGHNGWGAYNTYNTTYISRPE